MPWRIHGGANLLSVGVRYSRMMRRRSSYSPNFHLAQVWLSAGSPNRWRVSGRPMLAPLRAAREDPAPPAGELPAGDERALAKLKGEWGREHRMLIDGQEVRAQTTFEDSSPINQDWVLGRFQQGGVEHAEQALAAARQAFQIGRAHV